MKALYNITDLGACMEATGARYSVVVRLFDEDGNLVKTECCERRSREVAESTVDVYCKHYGAERTESVLG